MILSGKILLSNSFNGEVRHFLPAAESGHANRGLDAISANELGLALALWQGSAAEPPVSVAGGAIITGD